MIFIYDLNSYFNLLMNNCLFYLFIIFICGAGDEQFDCSPLYRAAIYNGYIQIVQLLISAGANVNYQNKVCDNNIFNI